MGIYSEYLDRFAAANGNKLVEERKNQLKRISQINYGGIHEEPFRRVESRGLRFVSEHHRDAGFGPV
jgi:hypothetical protein